MKFCFRQRKQIIDTSKIKFIYYYQHPLDGRWDLCAVTENERYHLGLRYTEEECFDLLKFYYALFQLFNLKYDYFDSDMKAIINLFLSKEDMDRVHKYLIS